MALVGHNLNVAVDDVTYLKDISFTFEPGRIYVVMGRTGAGKTSFMRAVSGLLPLDSGTLSLNGEDITHTPVWKRDCAMVYQQFINYPNKSVRQNVEFPLKKAGLSGSELDARVNSYLAKVGLTEFASRKPSQLSGGQQQRVALARSLARHSRILMLDEPLMNLDFKLREQLREEFLELFRGENQSVTIYATTEITEAMMLGAEILVMHEGQILQSGKPEEVFERPKDKLVAQIVNDPPMSIIRATITGSTIVLESGTKLPLPAHFGSLAEGSYEFGIRAIDVHPAGEAPDTESGEVGFVEVSGSETVLYVHTSAGEIVVQIEGIHDYHAGQKLAVAFRPERMFAFDDAGQLLESPKLEVK
jgi:glycerol transport system ATP-binding protein